MFQAIVTFLFLAGVLGCPLIVAFFLGACVYVNQVNKKKCRTNCKHTNDCNKYYSYK